MLAEVGVLAAVGAVLAAPQPALAQVPPIPVSRRCAAAKYTASGPGVVSLDRGDVTGATPDECRFYGDGDWIELCGVSASG